MNFRCRLFIITALALLLALTLRAQDEGKYRQGIFLEAGGVAPFYSLNYTRRLFAAGLFPYLRFDPTSTALSEKKTELSFRPGVSAGWYFGR